MMPSYLLGLLVLRGHEKESPLGLESTVHHLRLRTKEGSSFSVWAWDKYWTYRSSIHPTSAVTITTKHAHIGSHKTCKCIITPSLVIVAKTWDQANVHQLINRFKKNDLATRWCIIMSLLKQSAVTGGDTGKASKHYAEWLEPVTKECACVISFARNVQNRQLYRDRRIMGSRGSGEEEWGNCWQTADDFFCAWWKCSAVKTGLMTQWVKCAAQAGGPGSSSQNTCEEVRHGVLTWNPRHGEAETGRSLRLTTQPSLFGEL